MKKLLSIPGCWAFSLLSGLLLLASCTPKSASLPPLFSRVPADASEVIYLHVTTIVESLGGSVDGSSVTLPDYLDSSVISSCNLQNSTAQIESGGALAEDFVAFKYEQDPAITIMYAISDRDKFSNAIAESGFIQYQTLDSITLYRSVEEQWYGTSYSYIALCGGCACWLDEITDRSRFDVAAHFRRIFASARQKSLAETPVAGHLARGNAGGYLCRIGTLVDVDANVLPGDLSQVYRGNVCFSFDLSATDITVQARCFDDEGQPLDISSLRQFGDLTATVNPAVLSYLAPHESLIYAVALKDMDWDATVDALGNVLGSPQEKAALAVAKTYLKYIDGTVAFGVGPAEGLASLMHMGRTRYPMNDLELTLVCELQSGKAETILSDLSTGLSTFNIPCEEQPDGLLFRPFGADAGTFYVRAKDNLLVISDRTITSTKDNAAVSGFPYSEYLGALVLWLNQDAQLMRDLDVARDFSCSFGYDGSSQSTTIRLSLSGDTQTGILEKLVRTATEIADRSDQFLTKYAN